MFENIWKVLTREESNTTARGKSMQKFLESLLTTQSAMWQVVDLTLESLYEWFSRGHNYARIILVNVEFLKSHLATPYTSKS